MLQKKIRVVLDTNNWISYLLGIKTRKYLTKIFLDKSIEIFKSDELELEIYKTISKPKIKKHLTIQKIQDLQTILNYRIKRIYVTSKALKCRDICDNFLLALSKDSNADYLITGDKDLLILKKYFKTKIITLKDFYNIIYK